jgi:Mor family transcriptional regulator
MTLKEFVNKNFGGNVAMFCRAYKISRVTAYDIINKGFQRSTKLRRKLEKQGVKFD